MTNTFKNSSMNSSKNSLELNKLNQTSAKVLPCFSVSISQFPSPFFYQSLTNTNSLSHTTLSDNTPTLHSPSRLGSIRRPILSHMHAYQYAIGSTNTKLSRLHSKLPAMRLYVVWSVYAYSCFLIAVMLESNKINK